MTENTPAAATRAAGATPATLTDPPRPHPLTVAIDSIDWSMEGAIDWELLACQRLILLVDRRAACHRPRTTHRHPARSGRPR